MIHDLEKHIQEWTAENSPIGKLLGYPDCCIKEFCQQPPILLQNSTPTDMDVIRYNAAHINGEFTGFLPCNEHANQIIRGEIKLEDLIDTAKRDAYLPDFPWA